MIRIQPKIRRVEPADAPGLARLAAETFFDTFNGTCAEEDMEGYLEATYSVERVRQELSNPDDMFFFAEVDGVPVGYIRMKEDDEGPPIMKKWKALECGRLYVKKEFHKTGVSQALMDFFMEHAEKNQYQVVWLSVWEFNFRAQRFYSKYGFVPSGHSHPFPIGNTPQTDIYLWKFMNGP
ncbi:MAG: GNAT family N-acetyltransferase [Bdellovibrionales bacterium]|nr:GNAT family N-acetyltransferase [Bdellovibrionales bacterium]